MGNVQQQAIYTRAYMPQHREEASQTEGITLQRHGWAASACGRWGRRSGPWRTARIRTCGRTETPSLRGCLCRPRTAPPRALHPRPSPVQRWPAAHAYGSACSCAAAARPGASSERSPGPASCSSKPHCDFTAHLDRLLSAACSKVLDNLGAHLSFLFLLSWRAA